MRSHSLPTWLTIWPLGKAMASRLTIVAAGSRMSSRLSRRRYRLWNQNTTMPSQIAADRANAQLRCSPWGSTIVSNRPAPCTMMAQSKATRLGAFSTVRVLPRVKGRHSEIDSTMYASAASK